MPQEDLSLSETVDTWTARFPVTHLVTLALQRKQAETGVARLQVKERVLLTACEFWSAAASGQLRQYLADRPLQRLRAASFAFECVGSRGVAATLREAEDAIGPRSGEEAASTALAELTQRLSTQSKVIENQLADYALTMEGDDESGDSP
jgi:hypothetical protein